MEFLLPWLIFSIVAGVIASARGRSGFGIFLLSLILSPLIGLLLACLLPLRNLPPVNAAAAERQARVPCPQCAELILPAAKVCRFCQSPVDFAAATPASPPSPGLGRALSRLVETENDKHRYPPS